VQKDYLAQLQDTLTTVPAVNKTDVLTLVANFGSLAEICDASMEELVLCPGMGDQKVTNLHQALHEPFFAPTAATVAAEDTDRVEDAD